MAEAAVIRVVVGLLLVVAAILLTAWLARRSGLLRHSQGSVLRLVGTLELGPRQRIAVVQVQDTWLVIGLNGNGMTPLHTLRAGDLPPEHATGLAFSKALAQRLGLVEPRS